MARLEFRTTEYIHVNILLEGPERFSAENRPEVWEDFFYYAGDRGYDYDEIVYVKRTNIIPITGEIVCTFLPFLHAAVLCLSENQLKRVLLLKYTHTLNVLARNFAPKIIHPEDEKWQSFIKQVNIREINIGLPPQKEPREFDGALDQIWSYKDYRIKSRPCWGSKQLQQEARKTHKDLDRINAQINANSRIKMDFPHEIIYRLSAYDLSLEVIYETFMIYQQPRTILLIQQNKTAQQN